MEPDLKHSIWRVINAPNKLALHDTPHLKAPVQAWLSDGTWLQVRSVRGEFFHVVVISGEAQGTYGYVWKGKSADGVQYVERVFDSNPDLATPTPLPEIPRSHFEPAFWKWLVAVAVAIVLAIVAFACSPS